MWLRPDGGRGRALLTLDMSCDQVCPTLPLSLPLSLSLSLPLPLWLSFSLTHTRARVLTASRQLRARETRQKRVRAEGRGANLSPSHSHSVALSLISSLLYLFLHTLSLSLSQVKAVTRQISNSFVMFHAPKWVREQVVLLAASGCVKEAQLQTRQLSAAEKAELCRFCAAGDEYKFFVDERTLAGASDEDPPPLKKAATARDHKPFKENVNGAPLSPFLSLALSRSLSYTRALSL